MGLSNHTPMLMAFPHCLKHSLSFNFYDIIKNILKDLKKPLKQLNRDRFHDINYQQEYDPADISLYEEEHEVRTHYLFILQSSLSLMQQQSKTDCLDQELGPALAQEPGQVPRSGRLHCSKKQAADIAMDHDQEARPDTGTETRPSSWMRIWIQFPDLAL
ncbi:hypothetical protein Cgig2_004565 [Carnegiea gigantea]|uniref:Uncharacterized protein n=1 Tax=Carnegiea gigantea TaxID=171969 RepID=A0A9Q1GNF4_9CARY|nr:hypothetical protein Cgig2_004565 [Carnegiea gigantea]